MHDKPRHVSGKEKHKTKHKEVEERETTSYIAYKNKKKHKSKYYIKHSDDSTSLEQSKSSKKRKTHREEDEESENKQHYNNIKLTDNSSRPIKLENHVAKEFNKFDSFEDLSSSSVERRSKKHISATSEDFNLSQKKHDIDSRKSKPHGYVIIHDKSLKSHNESYDSLISTPVKKKKLHNEPGYLSEENQHNRSDFDSPHSIVLHKKKKKSHRNDETVEVNGKNSSLEDNKIVTKKKRSYNDDIILSDTNTPVKNKQHSYTDNRNGLKNLENHSDVELVKKKKKKKRHTDSESSVNVEQSDSKTNNKHYESDNFNGYWKDLEHDRSPKENKKKEKHSFKKNGILDKFIPKQEPPDGDLKCDYDSIRDQLELSDKQRISDEHLQMLQELVVVIPWPVPESHLIETRMSTHPSKEQQAKFKEMGFDMKTDHYTRDEDERILKNWKKFCKLHDLSPDPRPFLAFEASRQSKVRGSVLPKLQRINFVRFLGHGMPNRCLFSVYRRFKKLFEVTKKGKFSPEEDAIIMNFVKNSHEANKFAQLAVVLNRDRHAILLRHKLLAEKCRKRLILMT